MEVDQKYITTIRMHDAKGSAICMSRKGEDYQLQLSSDHHTVNISLGLPDVRRLCQQILQLEMEENWKAQRIAQPDYKSFFFNAAPRSFTDNVAHWFTKMTDDVCVTNGKN